MKLMKPIKFPDTIQGLLRLRYVATNITRFTSSIFTLQSVYGVPDDGQSQPSPVHVSSQPSRKATKEDVQKEVTHNGSSSQIATISMLSLPSLQQSGTQTDELLPYLASSLPPPLSLPLHQITFLNIQLDRHCMKVSKVADSLMSYTEQFMEYDSFVSTLEPSNPWITDDTTFWDLEAGWVWRGHVAFWSKSLPGVE